MIIKLLGVMIDSNLQWKEHINCVNVKMLKCIAIMYNIRNIFTVRRIRQHYNSFIFPYIDYVLTYGVGHIQAMIFSLISAEESNRKNFQRTL